MRQWRERGGWGGARLGFGLFAVVVGEVWLHSAGHEGEPPAMKTQRVEKKRVRSCGTATVPFSHEGDTAVLTVVSRHVSIALSLSTGRHEGVIVAKRSYIDTSTPTEDFLGAARTHQVSCPRHHACGADHAILCISVDSPWPLACQWHVANSCSTGGASAPNANTFRSTLLSVALVT